MRFEYDKQKNRLNLTKHGVDFETAQTVFEDPYVLSQQDDFHNGEERYITLGEIAPGVVLFVVHTAFAAADGEEVIRLISARTATSREKKLYEEAHKRTQASDRHHRRKKGRRH